MLAFSFGAVRGTVEFWRCRRRRATWTTTVSRCRPDRACKCSPRRRAVYRYRPDPDGYFIMAGRVHTPNLALTRPQHTPSREQAVSRARKPRNAKGCRACSLMAARAKPAMPKAAGSVQFDEPQSVKFAVGNGRKGSRGSLDLTRLDLNLNHLYNEHRVLIERHARKLGHRPLWASMHAYTAVLYCKFRETLSCISPRSSITDRECAIRVARRKLGRPFGSAWPPC